MENVRVLRNITTYYSDYVKCVEFKEPKFYISSLNSSKRPRSTDKKSSYGSIMRTKTLVFNYVIMNDFDLFVTLTFNPKKVDSFDFARCSRSIRYWLNKESKISPDFKYIIIPERHKSGRWHWHALISGYSGKLVDSGVKTFRLQPIYNLSSYKLGFSTAIKIEGDNKSIASYITKYITKSVGDLVGRRKFYCSTNLNRPTKKINDSFLRECKSKTPLFLQCTHESKDAFTFVVPLEGDLGGV